MIERHQSIVQLATSRQFRALQDYLPSPLGVDGLP